jgi:hypothetical protein
MKRKLRECNELGGSVPVWLAAHVLAITPRRVRQLIENGKLDGVLVFGAVFVTVVSVSARQKLGQTLRKPLAQLSSESSASQR